MFDFAFSELVIILLVALVVVGPERLPKVARTAGSLWGRMQRYVHSVKNDIANDLAIEEAKKLRGTIHQEMSSIEQATLEARLALDRKVRDAQMGRATSDADEEKSPQDTQSPPMPGKSV